MIEQKHILLSAKKRGFHLVTDEILSQLDTLPQKGLVNLFLKHTSAALSINESYDSSVRVDMETIIDGLVPDSDSLYVHSLEGRDDMPAHFKCLMTGCSLTVPVCNGKLDLGTWQGIYLCEFRNSGGRRHLTVTVYS